MRPGADPRDDARGVQQGVDQPGAGRDREARHGVLGGAHEPDAGQEHDDPGGDDAGRVHLERVAAAVTAMSVATKPPAACW